MALPASALVTIWLSACLAGEAGPDDLDTALADGTGPETLHLVTGLSEDSVSFALALGALRRAGAVGATLALPVPGDPLGLAGPPEFNAAALEAGEAVIVLGTGLGLVPEPAGDVVVWRGQPATPAPPADPAEASRELRRALAEATHALVDLDIAHSQPAIADLLMDLRRAAPPALPPSYAGRSADLDRAARCREIAALALTDEGGALSASQIDLRRRSLASIDSAARRLLAAGAAAAQR